MEKLIQYFGKPHYAVCDEKCNKAWGRNNRPRVYLDIGEHIVYGPGYDKSYPDEDDELKLGKEINVDNYGYLADHELGEAPVNPGTYECDDAKPINDNEKGNKWCVRECERCVLIPIGRPEYPKDFSQRLYNCYPHKR